MLKLKYLLTSLSMVIGIFTFPGAAALAIVGGSYEHGTLSPFVRVSMSEPMDSRIPESTCSGTVIAPTWVLTAKHCIAGWDGALSYTPEQMHIKVASTGDTFLSYSVSRLVPLKKYDLALIETTEAIEGVQVVRYGKMPTASTWTYRVYGYGVTESHTFGDRPESSTVLKFLDVALDRRYRWGGIDFSSPEGSACFGDSGGAVMATNPESGVQVLVAVVSSGRRLGSLYCAPGAKTGAHTVDNTLSEISKYVGVAPDMSSLDDTQIVVTQSSIAKTICDKDWLQSQAISFKKIKQSALNTGVNKTKTHTPMLNIPVLLGGTLDNSSAIWVKKTGKYSVKHKRLLDLTLNAMVCRNTITLADATAAFSGKWSLVYDRYVR